MVSNLTSLSENDLYQSIWKRHTWEPTVTEDTHFSHIKSQCLLTNLLYTFLIMPTFVTILSNHPVISYEQSSWTHSKFDIPIIYKTTTMLVTAVLLSSSPLLTSIRHTLLRTMFDKLESKTILIFKGYSSGKSQAVPQIYSFTDLAHLDFIRTI